MTSPHESTPSLAPTLLPCATCGSNDVAIVSMVSGRFAVWCEPCLKHGETFRSKEQAVREWNTRAVQSEEKRCEGESVVGQQQKGEV